MRTITFDELGGMTVKDVTPGQDENGDPVEHVTQREIQASQLAAHLVMFQDDMTPEQLAQAQAIIAAQGGA